MMKKYFYTLVLFFISQNIFSQNINNFNDLVESEKKAAQKYFVNQVSTAGDNYDLKYHRFNWYVDPAVYAISGSVTSYFVVTAQPFTTVNFDFSDSLQIDSVIYHSTSLFNNQLNNVLTCFLPMNISNGTLDSIEIFYHGVPPNSGFGSFVQSSHAGDSVIWTLSEPFGAADWWPCKNNLRDKIDSIDVIVTTPSQYRVGSNGLLISETVSGTNKIFHWQSHYPIATYLIAIGVTNYATYSNYVPMGINDSLEVLNYVYPEELATWQAGTPDIISTIQLYDTLTIPYPFKNEKYGHLEFGWGGGMEHQTMTFVVAGNYHPLLAHECAHQWFGDKVTCGSWEDIWLNEGFATYFEGLTEEYIYPVDWYNWKSNHISYITSLPDGSVKCTDTTDINRIFDGRLTYYKGAYVLHMLRWQLGDSAFFQGLRNYLNDSLLAYNFAKTPDLKSHLENASGQNLITFFNQWYVGQGYPSYQISWSQNGSAVYLQVNQTTSDASVSFYEMPIPIEFKNATQDTIIVFNHTFSGQQFSANIPFAVDSVIFDPDLWLISANNTITLGIKEVDAENLFSVYPNPANDKLTVEFKNTSPKEIFMDDMLGKNILKISGVKTKNKIDISSLSKGNYLLHFRLNEKTFSQKILIQ